METSIAPTVPSSRPGGCRGRGWGRSATSGGEATAVAAKGWLQLHVPTASRAARPRLSAFHTALRAFHCRTGPPARRSDLTAPRATKSCQVPRIASSGLAIVPNLVRPQLLHFPAQEQSGFGSICTSPWGCRISVASPSDAPRTPESEPYQTFADNP